MHYGLPTVLVLDGQGGGIGKSIISALKAAEVNAKIVCAGTNPYAANCMHSAGADAAVVGEENIKSFIEHADFVTGPIGMLVPNALKGEISADIALAVANSKAVKVLVPLNKCNIVVAGVQDNTLAQNIQEVANAIKLRCEQMKKI